MQFSIRPARVPDDYERMAAIASTGNWETATAATFAEQDANFPTDALRHRLIAADPTDRAIGYGFVVRLSFDAPGYFACKVTVDPAFRRQGVGSALLAQLEAWAGAHGATHFEAKFRDDDPAFLAFAQKHGYIEEGHHFGSMLDLQAFDETPFVGVISRLQSEGIRFLTMADPHDEALERSLWAMWKAANADEPGCEEEPFPPFDDWHREFLEHPRQPLDLIHVAVDGDRVVGMTGCAVNGANLGQHFTGVAREYRGRGIALAVKLLMIRAARRTGAKWLKTGSDSRNAAMLSINKKLGYVYMPGMYRTFKREA